MMHTDEAEARFVTAEDAEWPAQLNDLATPPAGLWVLGKGRLNELAERGVVITGSRASTGYGDQVAADLANDLGVAGLVVVNGGGFGIDAAALRGAVYSAGVPAVVVLPCGLDVVFPGPHLALFRAVVDRGGVIVSEYPAGERPRLARFLRRQELLAALSLGAVLVEAAARSTARRVIPAAAQLGRKLMAVPGPVTSATSVMPHQLIRSGEAVMVVDGASVLAALGR